MDEFCGTVAVELAVRLFPVSMLSLRPQKCKCHALRRLDVRELHNLYCARLLGTIQGPLHELISDRKHETAFAEHCTELRQLILRKMPNRLHNLLCAVGRNLETIEISVRWKRFDITQVRSLCPNLTNISFFNRRGTTCDLEAYAELLCSYGPQLKFARFEGFSVACCQQVLIPCPNIRCWYAIGTHTTPIGALNTHSV